MSSSSRDFTRSWLNHKDKPLANSRRLYGKSQDMLQGQGIETVEAHVETNFVIALTEIEHTAAHIF